MQFLTRIGISTAKEMSTGHTDIPVKWLINQVILTIASRKIECCMAEFHSPWQSLSFKSHQLDEELASHRQRCLYTLSGCLEHYLIPGTVFYSVPVDVEHPKVRDYNNPCPINELLSTNCLEEHYDFDWIAHNVEPIYDLLQFPSSFYSFHYWYTIRWKTNVTIFIH